MLFPNLPDSHCISKLGIGLLCRCTWVSMFTHSVGAHGCTLCKYVSHCAAAHGCTLCKYVYTLNSYTWVSTVQVRLHTVQLHMGAYCASTFAFSHCASTFAHCAAAHKCTQYKYVCTLCSCIWVCTESVGAHCIDAHSAQG